MSDDIDMASETEQLDRTNAIAAASRRIPEIPACGECFNCHSSVPPGARWCDGPCRDDWTDRRNAEIRRGVA